MTDAELIENCLRGDNGAWEELITRYKRLIYSVARSVCTEPEDAADVFQYVCLEWYQILGHLRSVRTLPAWLITVTRRRALRVVREQRSAVELRDFEAMSDGFFDSRLAAIEQEHAIAIALERLPKRCGLLLNLLYIDPEKPSYADVARLLEMPLPSIGPTRARCLAKLRKLLDEK